MSSFTLDSDSACVIKLKNPQNNYYVALIHNEEEDMIRLTKGDSLCLYLAVERLPLDLCEYEDSTWGEYWVDLDIPIVKMDTLDIIKYDIPEMFFMDVNFDGKEEFIFTLEGNGKLLYECYNIDCKYFDRKNPKLIKPMQEEPYCRFASGIEQYASDYTFFDYHKKEIFICTTSGCCIFYNTWAKYFEGGKHRGNPCVKVVKQERHSFQNEGEEGIETVEIYVLTNDSLKLVDRKEIPF